MPVKMQALRMWNIGNTEMQREIYELSLTTQGPSYPPSEVMDQEGNFIVIGRVNRMGAQGQVISQWSRAVVSSASILPPFGEQAPYKIIRELSGNFIGTQGISAEIVSPMILLLYFVIEKAAKSVELTVRPCLV